MIFKLFSMFIRMLLENNHEKQSPFFFFKFSNVIVGLPVVTLTGKILYNWSEVPSEFVVQGFLV